MQNANAGTCALFECGCAFGCMQLKLKPVQFFFLICPSLSFSICNTSTVRSIECGRFFNSGIHNRNGILLSVYQLLKHNICEWMKYNR